MSAGNRFENEWPQPRRTLAGALRWKLNLAPKDPPVHTGTETAFIPPSPDPTKPPSPESIRLTWIGHSTFLIQHRGLNILTDPIFGDCDPLPFVKIRRLMPPGIELNGLPRIDHVLISHSHYDHLDDPSIRALGNAHGNNTRYWLPERLGPWFSGRDIERWQEMRWWQSIALPGALTIYSVPAQHFSGRTPFDRDHTHWCGWVLRSPNRSIYFAGDTGYSPSFREIGERFGGFDLAIIPIGAYNPRWMMKPVHMNPPEAVRAHLDVRSRYSVACHWGTFNLSDEPVDEPPRYLASEFLLQHVDSREFVVLRPGLPVER